jgi:hypothetical protein
MSSCQHCGAEFKRPCDLTRHQKSAKSCLAIQREHGLVTAEPIYACECSEKFYLPYHLARHKTKCVTARPPIVINNTQNNTLNQNVFNINVFGSTMSSLTPEIIAKRVLEIVSLQSVEKGLAHMTAEVAQSAFTNEKGNWLVRVADGSRNKLMIRTDSGDIPDLQGHRTTQLLRKPFIEASLLALEQTKRPDDVENTIGEIQDDETYDRETMGALLRVAPSRFDQREPPMLPETYERELDRAMMKLERVMSERKKAKAKQLEAQALKWREEFLDRSQNLHDGTYWHPTYHFVIQSEETDQAFSILGRREKRSDTTQPLTKADIERLVQMGMKAYLAPEYAIRVAELTKA